MKWITIKSDEDLPKRIERRFTPKHVRYLKEGEPTIAKAVAYYFPDRFKTVEFDSPYTERDSENGCVWLRAGWYSAADCDNCEGYWSAPLDVIEWLDESPDSEAVEFHEWVGKQGYRLSHYAANGEAVHLHESAGSTPFHELRYGDWCTTKELYQIFKSQQDSQPTDTGGPTDPIPQEVRDRIEKEAHLYAEQQALSLPFDGVHSHIAQNERYNNARIHFLKIAEFSYHLALPRIKELEQALEGLLSLGRKDLSNPKYDAYFDAGSQALTPKTNKP